MNEAQTSQPVLDPLGASPAGASSGRSMKPWIFLGCGCLSLIVIGILGIVGFVLYQIKDSEAGRLAASSVRQSPTARQALGEIRDTGWPLGSISVEGGGSGTASFSMSVKGSKGRGKYYATLVRENGQWRVVSGRLELEDGRSIPLEGGATGPAAPALPDAPGSDVPLSGGRSLRADRGAASGWTPFTWPSQTIRFEVPADWEQQALEKREIEFRPKDRGAYFIGNLTYFDQKIAFAPLMQSLAEKAAAELKREEILGYARKDIGPAMGLLRLERRSDGQTTAVWSGYFDTPEFGTVSVTFLLGAPTPADFDRYEGELGAILESIRFQ
ncbi:MAG: cytochrome c oxidase assembly factor Coa1 family protein [bacterium]